PVGQPIEIRSRPHLDLDLVDGPPTVGANQQSRLLQLLEWNINVCRVILAHSALEKTHDREFVETRLWLLAGRGESQADLGAEVREVDVRLTLPRVPCPQRIADDRALIGNLLAPLDLELLLQGSFESVFRFPFDFLQTGPGRRDLLEPLRHLEGRLDLRAILVEEELGEITGSCPFRGPNADDLNRPRHRPAADAVLENARSLHGRSHGENIVTPCLLDPGHDFLEVVEAIHRGRLDHEIGKNTMQPVAHLVREPGHHRVDHDHRGDPEHDADHAGKRDVASAKIAPAEQVLVHVDHSFPGLVRRLSPRALVGQLGNGSPTGSPWSAGPGDRGRMSGNRITSRMLGRFIRIMQRRSMPMPSPPAGGMACLRARTKSSSILAIDSSSGNPASWLRNSCSCKSGSLSSV